MNTTIRVFYYTIFIMTAITPLVQKGIVFVSPATKVALSFLVVNAIYWSTIQALHAYCAPPGFRGFITSLWAGQHPMCRIVGSVYTSVDQLMLTWPGIAIGAITLYFTGMLPM